MATTTASIDWGTYREWQQGFTKFKSVTYEVGLHAALSDVNLEEGDNFPEDTDYEIVEAMAGTSPRAGFRLVSVTAFKEVTV